MPGSSHKNKVVLSLGGSLVVPNGGIGIEFLKSFNDFIRNEIALNSHTQFFIVVGGGSLARHYRDAGRDVIGHELTPDDLDWLGIHATRLNAHLLRTIFRDIAHPYILKHYEIIRKVSEPVIIASGWKPGWSTDFCAAMLCEDYHVKTIINMSNIRTVFDSDPKVNPNAREIKKCTWQEFRAIVGDEWVPGMNVPFDPIASKKAQEMGLKVVILQGSDLENLTRYFRGEEFIGTVVEG